MNFKEQVKIDIGATFLNLNEFADPHYLDGELLNCVVDADEFRQRMSRVSSEYVDGVFTQGVVLFANRDDLRRVPVQGERVQLDDEHYYVKQVQHETGMLILTLEANQS